MRQLASVASRPGNSQEGRVGHRPFVAACALSILIVIGGICFVHLPQARRIASRRERVAQLTGELARLDPVIDSIYKYKSHNRRLQSMPSQVRKFEARASLHADVLGLLAREMPQDVWLDSYMSRGSVIRLLGAALDDDKITELVRRLKSHPLFDKVELLYVWPEDRQGRHVETYGIEVTLAGRFSRPQVESAQDRDHAIEGCRDVFKPPAAVVGSPLDRSSGDNTPLPCSPRAAEPLELLDPSELAPRTVVRLDHEELGAIVEDPEGRAYLLELGAGLPRHRGKVVEIGPQGMRAIETLITREKAGIAVKRRRARQ